MFATYLIAAALALSATPATSQITTTSDIVEKEIKCTEAEKAYVDAKQQGVEDVKAYTGALQACLLELMNMAGTYAKQQMAKKSQTINEYLKQDAKLNTETQSYFIDVSGVPGLGKKPLTVSVPLPKGYQIDGDPDNFKFADKESGKFFKSVFTVRAADRDKRLQLYSDLQSEGGAGGGGANEGSNRPNWFQSIINYIKKLFLGFRRLFGLGG